MKQLIIILLISINIFSCSNNNVVEQEAKINSHYVDKNDVHIYSELVAVDGSAYYKQKVSPGPHLLHVRVLRANDDNKNQVLETIHRIQVTLNHSEKYSLINGLSGDMVEVWLINDKTQSVTSSRSSISTINERTVHLDKEIEDKNQRIKFVVNLTAKKHSLGQSAEGIKRILKNAIVRY